MPAELTAALGRLLADASLREALRHDPEKVSMILKVAPGTLQDLDLEGLNRQAQGLVEKRYHEVARRLPRTMAGLGGAGRSEFFDYAGSRWPEGHDRHLNDAAAFLECLEKRGLRVCRAERNRILFACGRSRISFRIAPDVWSSGRSRWAIQILIRVGTGVRSFAVYLGF